MRIKAATLATMAGAFLMVGCASTGGSSTAMMTSSTEPMAPAAAETTLEVTNHNWSDVVVYALHHTTRVRLGMVTSMNTRQFKLPRVMQVSTSDVRLVAAPIGSSEDFVTGPIHVGPGQRVELQLENTLAISNWSVW